jgi:hypothetical protein
MDLSAGVGNTKIQQIRPVESSRRTNYSVKESESLPRETKRRAEFFSLGKPHPPSNLQLHNYDATRHDVDAIGEPEAPSTRLGCSELRESSGTAFSFAHQLPRQVLSPPSDLPLYTRALVCDLT